MPKRHQENSPAIPLTCWLCNKPVNEGEEVRALNVPSEDSGSSYDTHIVHILCADAAGR